MMQSDTLGNKLYRGSRVTGHLRGAQWHPGGFDLPIGVHGTTCSLRGSLALTSAVLKADYSKAVPSLGLISWKLKRREERTELPSFLFLTKECIHVDLQEPDIFPEWSSGQNFLWVSLSKRHWVLEGTVASSTVLHKTHGCCSNRWCLYGVSKKAEITGNVLAHGRRFCLWCPCALRRSTGRTWWKHCLTYISEPKQNPQYGFTARTHRGSGCVPFLDLSNGYWLSYTFILCTFLCVHHSKNRKRKSGWIFLNVQLNSQFIWDG